MSPRSLLYVVLRVEFWRFTPGFSGTSIRSDDVVDICGDDVVDGASCGFCGLTASAFIHIDGILFDGSFGGGREGSVDDWYIAAKFCAGAGVRETISISEAGGFRFFGWTYRSSAVRPWYTLAVVGARIPPVRILSKLTCRRREGLRRESKARSTDDAFALAELVTPLNAVNCSGSSGTGGLSSSCALPWPRLCLRRLLVLSRKLLCEARWLRFFAACT